MILVSNLVSLAISTVELTNFIVSFCTDWYLHGNSERWTISPGHGMTKNNNYYQFFILYEIYVNRLRDNYTEINDNVINY